MVQAVRHGMTNREIADRRDISIDAVKFHVANIIGKLGLPDRRSLRRWSGAPKESRLNTRGTVMINQPTITGMGQVSRSTKDVKAAEAWYREILGLTHLYTFDKLAFFDCGGTRLMLAENEQRDATESILYFRVEDIDAACSELQARGIRFTHAPHMIYRHDDGTEEWMAFFEDLEGRPLAIMASA